MSSGRREVLRRMGMGLIGGGVALSGAGRGDGVMLRSVAHPTNPPELFPYPEGKSEYPTKMSPMDMARMKASQPLRDRISELEGYGDSQGQSVGMWMNRHSRTMHYDVYACKSTSAWFKDVVISDRGKAKQRTVSALYAEVQRLMSDPLESLDRAAREGIETLLAEVLK